MSEFIIPVISIIALVGLLVWLIRLLILTTRKIRNSFRELAGKNPAEVDKAYDIFRSCYKNGSVPSWAVYEAIHTLQKFYTEEAAIEGVKHMMKQNGIRYVELPAEYKLTAPATREQMAAMCINRFRKFNMEHFFAAGELSSRDDKVLDYLARMWYFADPDVQTIEEATETMGEVFIQFCRECPASNNTKG